MAVVNPDARPADDLVRYREDIRDGIYDGMVADQSGEWVRHSDVATLLAANDAQIATLRQDMAGYYADRANVQVAIEAERRANERADAAEFALRDARAETERLTEAIRWALGEVGEFPAEEPPPVAGKYRQRYHWRTELRRRAFGESR